MRSTITSKFQTTIPKGVRESLKLAISDVLDWELKNGKVILKPVQSKFLKHRNVIRPGKGDIEDDISESKKLMVEKHR